MIISNEETERNLILEPRYETNVKPWDDMAISLIVEWPIGQ